MLIAPNFVEALRESMIKNSGRSLSAGQEAIANLIDYWQKDVNIFNSPLFSVMPKLVVNLGPVQGHTTLGIEVSRAFPRVAFCIHSKQRRAKDIERAEGLPANSVIDLSNVKQQPVKSNATQTPPSLNIIAWVDDHQSIENLKGFERYMLVSGFKGLILA